MAVGWGGSGTVRKAGAPTVQFGSFPVRHGEGHVCF